MSVRRLELLATIHFVNTTGEGDVPDGTDTVLELGLYDDITLQIDSDSDANHTATDYDINVITSPDQVTWDKNANPYQSWNLNAVDIITTKNLTTGPAYGKLRCDENASLRADVYVKVFGRRRK